MKLVDLTLAVGVLKLPHPLAADDEYFQRIIGRARHRKVNFRAPDKHDHGQGERDHRPGDFQRKIVVDQAGGMFFAGPVMILNGKVNDRAENEQRKKSADHYEKKINRIDAAG